MTKVLRMTSLQWMDDALCRQVGTELFFPEVGTTPHEAKSVCSRCPVTSECLQFALSIPGEVYGVWGGTTVVERRQLRRNRAA